MSALLALAAGAVAAQRLRSVLSTLGIAIGIAAVILLTSIGEGAKRYIVGQFTQFGTDLVAIHPGRSQTTGLPGVLGGTTHKLTLDDAAALERVPGVAEVLPVTAAEGRVEGNGRGRSVFVYGVTPNLPRVWRSSLRQGGFWPAGELRRGAPVAVLGPKLRRELFGESGGMERFVRIAGARLRVVGVLEPKGQFLGFDIDDSAYVPVATAIRLFNRPELTEIDIVYRNARLADRVAAAVREVLIRRHDGREDFTITSQAAMLAVFGNVMNVITLGVGAIGGISLLVGAVGILTMMWIAVGERTAEIGLLRAVGAGRRQVQLLFLAEAAVLATAGGLLGIAAGLGLAEALRLLVPGLPVETPPVFVGLALLVSLATGLISGFLPARRAARLDPIEALRAE